MIIEKQCTSHSDCKRNQFCNYGQCDNIPTGKKSNPHEAPDDKLLSRFNGKRCSSQRDCEWYESCVVQYGICWRTWPRLPRK